MQPMDDIVPSGFETGKQLAGVYMRAFLWYLLGMAVLWSIGIEGIYGSPFPFYALAAPAYKSLVIPGAVILLFGCTYVVCARWFGGKTPVAKGALAALAVMLAIAVLRQALAGSQSFAALMLGHWTLFRWHLLVFAVGAIALAAFVVTAKKLHWPETDFTPRARRWLLVALLAVAFAFAGAVAMIRNGPAGISQAYERHGYEYVSDIGVTGSIYNLFHDYPKFRPFLSMHAKVHPPGPIALLWLISYGVGQEPLPLSLATMLIGVLALIPLFLWARDMAGERVAVIACMLYCLMPSIVLFTATSADILFTPITLFTLFFFWRALHRRSLLYATASGITFAAASFMSFNLLTIGAFFALAGLWRFAQAGHRLAVIQTAIVMCAAFLGFHAAIRWWSGFDMIACFHACKDQLYLDQANLDLLQPRFPGWLWRILNPVCWFYFAGIPVSLLFIGRLLKPEPQSRAQSSLPPFTGGLRGGRSLFLIMAGSALAMTLLYLARGEGERSAMYILPFIVVPAAHMLDNKTTAARSIAPMAATLIFLAFQCWFTESYFYTFW